MALKRLVPEQDTFIAPASSELNYGADEILELGATQYGTPARILVQFSSNDIRNLTAGKDYTAIIHLSLSEAENLPVRFNLVACTLPQEWVEGIGRTGDNNSEGATWTYTGKYTPEGEPIPWDEPGGLSVRVFDGEYANLTYLRYIINNGDSTANIFDGFHISGGGAQGWERPDAAGVLRVIERGNYKTGALLADLELDVTDIVKAWETGENMGMILEFEDEKECELLGTRMSFYSRDTHTVYRPYLEIRWDESEYEPGDLPECEDIFGTFANNLREEYTVGDQIKINFSNHNRYASRVWSTGSIYQTPNVLPETSYWGIKDEYTNEMVVPFDSRYTKVSADGSGSFFILDTSNLEPERYYRLLVQIKQGEQEAIVDNRNIFRVGRNGQYKG